MRQSAFLVTAVASITTALACLACGSPPEAVEPEPQLRINAANTPADTASDGEATATSSEAEPPSGRVEPTTPTPVDPHDTCRVRGIDFSTIEYPASAVSDSAFQFRREGKLSVAQVGKGKTRYTLFFGGVEFGVLDGSEQPAALVYFTRQREGDTGNAIPRTEVFVFRMSGDCQLGFHGTFVPYTEGTFEGGAYVVAKRPGREEWRIVDGEIKRTLNTDTDPLASVAPAWKARDLRSLAGKNLQVALEADADLRALFQATLGKRYWDFYWNMTQGPLRYSNGQLSGEGCRRVNCLERAAFTLSDQGELYCSLPDARRVDYFGPKGKQPPEGLKQKSEAIQAELKSLLE